MRIEAGSDDDEGTTTGAGGVSRAVRLAVRIEAERDDDDAAMTGAGGVSRAVRIAVRIEGTTTQLFVATVCGYRLWLPFVATDVATDVAAAPRCPHSQPPRRPHSRCSPPGPVAAAPRPSQSLQAPNCPL